MTTADDLLNVARGELGYIEGPGNNETKYWAELEPGMQGQPWCAAFVSWCHRHAGVPLPAIDRPYGFVYCPDAVAWANRNGRLVNTPQPGDVLIYGGGVHTGIYEKPASPGQFYAIEGNTSPGTAGDQTNGGGVYRRLRSLSWVTAIVRPVNLATAAPAPAPSPAPVLEEDPMFQFSNAGRIILCVGGRLVHVQTPGDGSALGKAATYVGDLSDQQTEALVAAFGPIVG